MIKQNFPRCDLDVAGSMGVGWRWRWMSKRSDISSRYSIPSLRSSERTTNRPLGACLFIYSCKTSSVRILARARLLLLGSGSICLPAKCKTGAAWAGHPRVPTMLLGGNGKMIIINLSYSNPDSETIGFIFKNYSNIARNGTRSRRMRKERANAWACQKCRHDTDCHLGSCGGRMPEDLLETTGSSNATAGTLFILW